MLAICVGSCITTSTALPTLRFAPVALHVRFARSLEQDMLACAASHCEFTRFDALCSLHDDSICTCLQVSLATDFMWNWNAREATAAFGYDYILRQCRLRGRVDTDGKV